MKWIVFIGNSYWWSLVLLLIPLVLWTQNIFEGHPIIGAILSAPCVVLGLWFLFTSFIVSHIPAILAGHAASDPGVMEDLIASGDLPRSVTQRAQEWMMSGRVIRRRDVAQLEESLRAFSKRREQLETIRVASEKAIPLSERVASFQCHDRKTVPPTSAV